ncbi:mevalonate kinase [Candidatus Microgenomates bacterium]|nr:MAG: mevalonate kinase [Candidatus Microgenomates bacterium]
MKKVLVSAPGKLLLFSDHAVVYGKPCIVTAINQRLTVTISENNEGTTHFETGNNGTRFVEAALIVGSKQLAVSRKGFTITTISEFSGKYGFGSSAAVTVATVKALSDFNNKSLTNDEFFSLSFAAVRKIQPKASGFDVAASVFGGTLWYEKEKPPQALAVDWKDVALVVGYSGVKADTPTMVEQVAGLQAQNPQKFAKLLTAMEKLVEQAKQALVVKDWQRVGILMNYNQEYLRDLGVSTEKLEALISAAKHAGAFGAKLSGAGGGDSMIALVSNDKKEIVEKAITEAGGEVVSITPDEEGVRLESV